MDQPDTVMIRTAAGRLRRVNRTASSDALATGGIHPQHQSGAQFRGQFIRASDMQMSSTPNSVHEFAPPQSYGLWGFVDHGTRGQ